MTFDGWPRAALDFYRGLEVDNSKAYWLAHREVYEQKVLQPMTELLDELAEEFGQGRVFRPYRDVRFSADKSLYKTAIGATLSGGGYVQLSARGLAAGAGCHRLAPDQLERYRRAVDTELSGEDLRARIAAVEAHGIEITVRDALKTVPRGYPKEHPRADLLTHKDLAAWTEWGTEAWLQSAEAKEYLIAFLHDARPLTTWLDEHVGPTTLTR
ncbi:DUF2461 domain-containing protein [Leifsonia kafniensis]|uniref:DUF2461 domain-containing protein n=1 Tax=Leifsonia kafniensis TaxID=475957 RepID=A0ABP7K1L0_9MICO